MHHICPEVGAVFSIPSGEGVGTTQRISVSAASVKG